MPADLGLSSAPVRTAASRCARNLPTSMPGACLVLIGGMGHVPGDARAHTILRAPVESATAHPFDPRG